jgi:hypothetical protein
MSNKTRTNQKVRLLNFLAKGKEFSVAQIRKSLRIANPSAVVAELRCAGARIYTNEHRGAQGQTIFKYRLAQDRSTLS